MAKGTGGRGAPGADDGPRRSGPARLACLLALVLVIWGVFAQRTYAILPADGEHLDARTLFESGARVDGVTPENEGEFEYLLRLHRPGEQVDLGPAGPVTLVPEADGALLWVTLLNALSFWTVCAFALAPRLGVPGIRDLFACLLLASVAIAIGGVSPPHVSMAGPLPLIWIWSLALMPPFFVRFALAFPQPLGLLERHPRLVAPAFLAAAGVAAWGSVAWIRCFEAPRAEAWAGTVAPMAALLSFLFAGGVVGCLTLWWNGRQARTPRAKRQVKWILFGSAVGAAPYVLFRALPRTLHIELFSVPPIVDRIVEMVIPAALAIAVVKERFLDIDVIIRRSLLYTLLALGAAGLFFLTAVFLGDLLTPLLGVGQPVLWGVAGAITGLLVWPARQFVARWIDRTFFRIRFEHEQALAVLRRTLSQAGGQAELASRLSAFLDGVLEPRTHGVLVASGDEREAAGTVDAALLEASPDLVRALVDRRALARPGSTASPEIESEDFPARLADADVEVVQPVAREGRLQALMLLGTRRTGHRWVQEDIELLEAAAEEVAKTLERLELVQQVAEEALERRTLAELSRQKADFFARLAHDLRTPITAVRWSTRNLLDGLPGPLNDRQTQYLTGVEAAAGQLDRLVYNLVDLGRLDLEAPEREPEPVDLTTVVNEAATALTAVAEARKASIVIDAPSDLPPVRGRPESAFQVVINLVENALKHAPADSAVEVRIRPADYEVHLTVRDHGPGLPVEERDGLFDLFRQAGSEDEKKRGYGIGLYIVRAWMEAMGGTVEADNHPDGGARFTCRFVLWMEEGKKA